MNRDFFFFNFNNIRMDFARARVFDLFVFFFVSLDVCFIGAIANLRHLDDFCIEKRMTFGLYSVFSHSIRLKGIFI